MAAKGVRVEAEVAEVLDVDQDDVILIAGPGVMEVGMVGVGVGLADDEGLRLPRPDGRLQLDRHRGPIEPVLRRHP